MRRFIKDNWREALKVAVIILVMSFIAVVVSEKLKTETFQQKVEIMGLWGPVVIIFYIAASHIVVPLAGTPGTVVALSVYGLVKGWILIYLGSLISASVNFYIARVLGRKWVIRLAGKDSVRKIDKFVNVMGTKLLIMARLVGFPLYEFISYAVGFTNMSFTKYFVITATLSLISGTIISILFYYSLASPILLSILLGVIILVGVLFTSYTIWLYQRSVKDELD